MTLLTSPPSFSSRFVTWFYKFLVSLLITHFISLIMFKCECDLTPKTFFIMRLTDKIGPTMAVLRQDVYQNIKVKRKVKAEPYLTIHQLTKPLLSVLLLWVFLSWLNCIFMIQLLLFYKFYYSSFIFTNFITEIFTFDAFYHHW